MVNPHMDQFMASFPGLGLTFDDVSLLTQYADFLPDDTDVTSRFSRNVPLNVPFVSAAMDTVTEADMAIAVALLGGIGVVHKNQSPDKQAAEVSRVKHYLNGLITDPVVFRKDIKVSELLAAKERHNYQFAGFPIVDNEEKLVGILTARDVKFITDYDVSVDNVMTTDLVVGQEGTTTAEAFDIMLKHRVGKLPIVDADRCLVGLYSFHDVRTITENIEPTFNRDEQHRLRVAAAIGPWDEERIDALTKVGVDAVVLDTAHGHSKGVIETLKLLKRDYNVDVVAGNIGTAEGARALLDAGADAVKVGIGPGSICTTRIVAGVGIPQLTAVYEVRSALGDSGVPVISDGGITYSGDVAKAVAAGADCVMMGSALAGTEECPGERILHQGRTYVVYRGMGSVEAMKEGRGSRERYCHKEVRNSDELVPQGIEGLVPYRGRVADVLHQYIGGLRFALGYCGARTLSELQRTARFIRISPASLEEAHPHDVKMLKDAPNYRTR